jgi:hypothetical protein
MPSSPPVLRRLEQAWFQTSVADFIGMSKAEIIGRLVNREQHSVEAPQIAAWNAQITVLKHALAGLAGHVLFEFDIPRMGRRIDAVVITGAIIFVTSCLSSSSSATNLSSSRMPNSASSGAVNTSSPMIRKPTA